VIKILDIVKFQIIEIKNGKRIKKEKYDNLESIFRKIKKTYKKKHIKVIPVPEVYIGFPIYTKDQSLYGIVSKETEHLYFLTKESENDRFLQPSKIEDRYLNEDFVYFLEGEAKVLEYINGELVEG
jgi:hypothetical protein